MSGLRRPKERQIFKQELNANKLTKGEETLEFKLEKMKPHHLTEVLGIEKVSFPQPWSRRSFLGELRENRFAHYYVGIYDKQVVGYAGIWVIMGDAHITTVAVHPLYRRRKIGKFLMQHLLKVALKYGAERVTLEVRVSNKAARNLYETLGFCTIGRRKSYYTDTMEDAIIMHKEISVQGTENLR